MEHIEVMLVVIVTIACILAIYLVKKYLCLYGIIRKDDICYYKQWHGLYNDTSSRVAPEVLAGQNYQISEAFRHLQISVDKLNYFSPLRVVPAEKILRYAFELVTDKDALNELVESTITREHTFVADSLKNTWPILAPKVDPGRTFVKGFCQNLKSNKDLCYSAIEEAHSCLESYEWTIGKIISLVEKNVKIEKNKVMRQICSFFRDGNGHKSYSDDVKNKLFHILNLAGIKKTIALDTEIVGAGYKGCIDMVSRVSLVDKKQCIYDKYVKPIRPVTDYRTTVNSVSEADLSDAEDFSIVQKEVADLIQSRILVGYDLDKDLQALNLKHPEEDIRDTSMYPPFRKVQQQKPSLKSLSKEHLDRDTQNNEHCSLDDAIAARDLYLKFAKQWEKIIQHMGHKAIQAADGVRWPSHVYRPGGSRGPQDIDAWELLRHLKQQGFIFRDP